MVSPNQILSNYSALPATIDPGDGFVSLMLIPDGVVATMLFTVSPMGPDDADFVFRITDGITNVDATNKVLKEKGPDSQSGYTLTMVPGTEAFLDNTGSGTIIVYIAILSLTE